MEYALPIDEPYGAATIQKAFDNLAAGESLGSTASEQHRHTASGISVALECRVEPNAAVVVAESREKVEITTSGLGIANPEILEDAQEIMSRASPVDIRL
jgi:hypothetical protein